MLCRGETQSPYRRQYLHMSSHLQLPLARSPLLILGFLWAAPGFSSYSPRKEHGQNDWLPPQPQFCVLGMHVIPIVKGDHVLYEPCLYLSWAVQTNRETWKRTRADGWASSNFVTCLWMLCSSAKLCHTPDESVAAYLFLDFSFSQGQDSGTLWIHMGFLQEFSQLQDAFLFLVFTRKVQRNSRGLKRRVCTAWTRT